MGDVDDSFHVGADWTGRDQGRICRIGKLLHDLHCSGLAYRIARHADNFEDPPQLSRAAYGATVFVYRQATEDALRQPAQVLRNRFVDTLCVIMKRVFEGSS